MIAENDVYIREGVEYYISEINNYPTATKNYVFYRLRKVGDYDRPYEDVTEFRLNMCYTKKNP